MSEDVPIMPPVLESMNSSPPPTPTDHHVSHRNAVQNVMRELADAKEHIDRLVLPSSHTFGGRPCLNMKEFFKLMTEKDKKQQNLDALHSLVENDSDSIIGFVELNGLSFIDEWLDTARKDKDHWFSLCILQFLAHDNLSITYEALQTAPIAKAVKQFVNPISTLSSSPAVLSPHSVPRLTDNIRSILPHNLNVSRAQDNFIAVIDRSVIHKICHEHQSTDAIRYLQSQFANRIVNKWKKFVGEWKKSNSVTKYRDIRFADEQLKPIAISTTFHANDTPMLITEQRDKKRRDKMTTTVKWYHPQRMYIDPVYDSDQKVIERGRDSHEKKIQKERVSTELEEFAIGTDNLKDPTSLKTNQATVSNVPVTVIPLESEQTSPSPEENNEQNVVNIAPPTHRNMLPYPPHMMAPRLPPAHPGYPPSMPPPPAYRGYAPHPYNRPPPGYHPNMPPPPYPPHPGYPPPNPMAPHPMPVPYHGHYAAQNVVHMRQLTNSNSNGNVPNINDNVPKHTQLPQTVNGHNVQNKNQRKRDFDVNRPAKRQKIHDRHYDDTGNVNHYRRRKRHNKHRNKHDKRHKNRRGRMGRRAMKDGMTQYETSYRLINHTHNEYNTPQCIAYNFSGFDLYQKGEDQQEEYLFVYFMFLFLAICYYLFGNKFGFLL